MLNATTTGKRTAGKLMILATVAVALPLTATRAIEYIDVPAPPAPPAANPAAPAAPGAPVAPVAPTAPMVQAALAAQADPLAPPAPPAPPAPNAPLAPPAPAAPLAPLPGVAPTAPVPPVPPSRHYNGLQVNGDNVFINGKAKRWNQLTPAEKAYVRSEIAKAREELKNTKIDRAEIDRDVREALRDAEVSRRDAARDIAQSKVEMDQALREIDANAGELRKHGVDPEAIKAQVRASMKAVEAIDIDKITRQAMASVDPDKIAASVAAAEASIAKAQAEMDRIESKLDDSTDDD